MTQKNCCTKMDFSYYEMDILVKQLNVNSLHGLH